MSLELRKGEGKVARQKRASLTQIPIPAPEKMGVGVRVRVSGMFHPGRGGKQGLKKHEASNKNKPRQDETKQRKSTPDNIPRQHKTPFLTLYLPTLFPQGECNH
jgi:hypothetical protein